MSPEPAAMTKDEAQRSIRTFYVTVNEDPQVFGDPSVNHIDQA